MFGSINGGIGFNFGVPLKENLRIFGKFLCNKNYSKLTEYVDVALFCAIVATLCFLFSKVRKFIEAHMIFLLSEESMQAILHRRLQISKLNIKFNKEIERAEMTYTDIEMYLEQAESFVFHRNSENAADLSVPVLSVSTKRSGSRKNISTIPENIIPTNSNEPIELSTTPLEDTETGPELDVGKFLSNLSHQVHGLKISLESAYCCLKSLRDGYNIVNECFFEKVSGLFRDYSSLMLSINNFDGILTSNIDHRESYLKLFPPNFTKEIFFSKFDTFKAERDVDKMSVLGGVDNIVGGLPLASVLRGSLKTGHGMFAKRRMSIFGNGK
ncbi:MAG: hypothetical protein KAH32_03675 [Chlamydiia bacterium]|nr:hypothetical protein [Chlamydiia bacterium]